MNDHLPDDELASAYLDGETDADERARVESSPRLLERVAELRSVSERLSKDRPTLRADDEERLLETALADDPLAAGRQHRQGGDETGGSPPLALPVEDRQRHRGGARWLPQPAIAAAVLVVLMLTGVALIVSGRRGGDGSSDLRSAGGSAATERSAGSTSATSTAGRQNAASIEGKLPDLGTFDARPALTRALAAVDPGSLQRQGTPGEGNAPDGSSTSGIPTAINRCDQVLRSSPGRSLGPALAAATATLSGRSVLIISNPVQGSRPPKTQLSVVDPVSCVVQFAVER